PGDAEGPGLRGRGGEGQARPRSGDRRGAGEDGRGPVHPRRRPDRPAEGDPPQLRTSRVLDGLPKIARCTPGWGRSQLTRPIERALLRASLTLREATVESAREGRTGYRALPGRPMLRHPWPVARRRSERRT